MIFYSDHDNNRLILNKKGLTKVKYFIETNGEPEIANDNTLKVTISLPSKIAVDKNYKELILTKADFTGL